jgi:HlyD family secretion protein
VRVGLGLLAMGLLAVLVRALVPKPIAVDTALVRKGRLETFVEEDGRTRVRMRYVVSAPLTANLRRIDLRPGDTVEEGQVVALLDPPNPVLLDPHSRSEMEARLMGSIAREQQASTAAERAASANEISRLTLERSKKLSKRRAISEAELDRAELEARIAADDLASAQLQRKVASAEVSSIRAMLGRSKNPGPEEIAVTAPSAGRVLRVQKESAGLVQGGTALLEIGDPRALEVVVDVLSADAVRIQRGARAIIEEWGGERPLAGTVQRIEPSAFTRVSALGIEEQRVNLIIALAEVPESLGDGYRVEAKVLEWAGEDILIAPRSAVFRQKDQWAAYVADRGRALDRRLEIGHRGTLDVEVTSGLRAGEQVILYPGERISDGSRIEVRK